MAPQARKPKDFDNSPALGSGGEEGSIAVDGRYGLGGGGLAFIVIMVLY